MSIRHVSRARQTLVLLAATGAIALLVAGFFAGVGSIATPSQATGLHPAAARAPAPARAPARRRIAVRPPSRFSVAAQRRRARVFAAEAKDTPFVRLGEPQPGEWLDSFKERGQSFADYIAATTNRKTRRRATLHLLPFDDLSARQRRLLPILRDYLARFYSGLRVVVLPTRRLDSRHLAAARGQYDAEAIAADIARRVPASSLGVLGLTNHDLYVTGLNYVFGVGLFRARAGVHSLKRYGHAWRPLLRRALKLAAHELGHMLTIRHCVFYRCTMNGTNSLAEMDRQPLHACPQDLLKLQHNLGFDRAARYRSLARFYKKHGLSAAARFVAARARSR